MPSHSSRRRDAARWSGSVAALLAWALGSGCLLGTTPAPRPDITNGSLIEGNYAARESAVLAQLQQVKTAEDMYFLRKNEYGTFEDLIEARALNRAPDGLGYTVDLWLTDDGYEVIAVPIEYGVNGKRSFYMDQSGKVRGADHEGGAASADDPRVN